MGCSSLEPIRLPRESLPLPVILEAGDEALEAGRLVAADYWSRVATQRDGKSAAALELRGRVLARGPRPADRRSAARAFEATLALEPERATALSALAFLREAQGFRWLALKTWERYARAHPEAPEPLYQMGRYFERRFVEARADRFAVSWRAQAARFFREALERDPSHRESRLRRALLAIRVKDFEAAATDLSLLRGLHEVDETSLLAEGYLLASTLRDSLAWERFTEALGPVGRSPADDPRLILPTGEEAKQLRGRLNRGDSEALRRYWIGRDPLLLTERNERLLEHRRRWTWARLFAGPEGQSDDGLELVLRYGEPARVDRFVTFGGVLPGEPMVTLGYPQLNLNIRGLARGRSFVMDDASARSMAAIRAVRPEDWGAPHLAETVDVPLRVAAFRGREPGRMKLRFFYESRVDDLTGPLTGTPSELATGVFLIGADGSRLLETIEPLSIPITAAGRMVIGEKQMEVPPGRYMAAVELLHRRSRRLGRSRLELEVPDLWQPGLGMSDLIFGPVAVGTQIQSMRSVLEPGGEANQEGFTPRATARHASGGKVGFYMECYGLGVGDDGRTRYQTRVVLHRLQGRGRWEQGAQGGERVEITNEVKSFRRDEGRFFILELAEDYPGRYGVEVVLRDLVASRAVSRRAELVIGSSLQAGPL